MPNVMFLFKALHLSTKFASVPSSYGWGRSTIKHVQELLSNFKIEVVSVLEINGDPTKKQMQQIVGMGKVSAQKIKEEA